ncbi:IclR family transcriptional regulator domain-containing protein [Paraburkholderia oxyphila]|uniref:IclR family transcriptional regulator domain-containing protein n=1 Tax=Paraburkholderia oxyphila TaxID=614212 RepID=UPI00069342D2|nr:IclR family transcriptional regulator C-terminal domain-containing protein [Paraburkholderia oxyphila]
MNSDAKSKRSSHANDEASLMRGPLRTIAVLRALNVRNGATVAELSAATGISRPALYRILETLRSAGYVSVNLRQQRYCLTMLVRTLAQGFSDEDWVTQVARPVLSALQRKVLWPVDLGTFMNNAMWIRETTRQSSPLTIDRGVVGLRFPMLQGATGRAYLAFCPDNEREQILANLSRLPEPGNEMIERPAEVEALLQRTREQGYGLRYGEEPTETGAIAVPIVLDERIIGCINMTFIASALRPEEAARQHLAAMLKSAKKIAAGVLQLETDVNDASPLSGKDET